MKKPLIFGILGAMFFAFTFLCNRSMNLAGGFWMWNAILRYGFTLVILLPVVWRERGFGAVFRAIRYQPVPWMLWSTVGFGLFYLPSCAASVYGESWFTAATWQLTIVCGILLTPLFGKKIPLRNLGFACVILVGVALLQWSHIATMKLSGIGMVLVLILIGATMYPLGNRKMMTICPQDMTTSQRVFGMTLCSMPFWGICSVIAMFVSGPPTGNQLLQSLVVALFSGVIATLLFFEGTNLVRHDPAKLALVEATQCGEVLFTLLFGVLFLGDALPDIMGFIGIAVILIGMTGSSLVSAFPKEKR